MSSFDRFAIFIIDDQEEALSAWQGMFTRDLAFSFQVSDARLASLELERNLVTVTTAKTQAEAELYLEALKNKEGERFTCFFFDYDLSEDQSGGKLSGGLSLWLKLMTVVSIKYQDEFLAAIYTRSPDVKKVLEPLFGFPQARPLFLNAGETQNLDMKRVSQYKPIIANFFHRLALTYASRGTFKTGIGQTRSGSPFIDQTDLPVSNLLREDMRRLISMPIDRTFWHEFGEIFSGRRYYLEIKEGDGFFWTRQFNLANLFPYETKAILDQSIFTTPNEMPVRANLVSIYSSLFPSFQAAYYEFCQFFDMPFNQFLSIPHVVYNEQKKEAYGNISAYLTSLFSEEQSKKLSHLTPSNKINMLNADQIRPIKEFLGKNYEEMLRPDVYCMDSLRNTIRQTSTGEDLHFLTKFVREQLIDFPLAPAKPLMSIIHGDESRLTDIQGAWNFMDYPLYTTHIIQLIKIFVNNFEKHNTAEFQATCLEKLSVRFVQQNDTLELIMSAPGQVTDWGLVKSSLEQSLTPSCQPEKLSGLRKIACEYYNAQVEIHSDGKMISATKFRIADSLASRYSNDGTVYYRILFPRFSNRG
jgi:hypothetical protein